MSRDLSASPDFESWRGLHERAIAQLRSNIDAVEAVGRIHLAEAISYRMASERLAQAA